MDKSVLHLSPNPCLHVSTQDSARKLTYPCNTDSHSKMAKGKEFINLSLFQFLYLATPFLPVSNPLIFPKSSLE
ncbi:hypothetical protein AQUCO_01700073v1 [Aquilegia coerulea]|uniref:Uncharacterized protein n=1 Tax=Aquilegia coerulea TaxID=218851 RepID=A0A2G5DL29_AQUCA|nr:hypothetical protein AQUCO_01700073v1 [Aquilegia coerulea]